MDPYTIFQIHGLELRIEHAAVLIRKVLGRESEQMAINCFRKQRQANEYVTSSDYDTVAKVLINPTALEGPLNTL